MLCTLLIAGIGAGSLRVGAPRVRPAESLEALKRCVRIGPQNRRGVAPIEGEGPRKTNVKSEICLAKRPYTHCIECQTA